MMIQEDELIDFCQQLVRTESLSGNEAKTAQLIQKKFMELGFDEAWIDSNGSVIGKIKGNEPGPSLLLDGHIDTVPASDRMKWTFDPFGGEISSGRIYGRGTSDMKGSVAAMIYAAAQLKKNGSIMAGDLYVSGTVFEEMFEGVALQKVVEQIKPDYVVIGESTGLNLNIGQRGRAEIKVTAAGKSAHSSNPQYGINAISRIVPFIQKLNELPPKEHTQLGQGISVVTDILSAPYPGASVVPHQCVLTIDRRLLIEENEETVLQQYLELAGEGIKVEFAEQELVTYTGESIGGRRFYPAWLMDVDHPIVQKSLRALRNMNLSPKISSYQFCTNGSYSAGIARVPTIGFGPSYEHMAHIVDEYIEINQLIDAADGYYAIAKSLLSKKGAEDHV